MSTTAIFYINRKAAQDLRTTTNSAKFLWGSCVSKPKRSHYLMMMVTKVHQERLLNKIHQHDFVADSNPTTCWHFLQLQTRNTHKELAGCAWWTQEEKTPYATVKSMVFLSVVYLVLENTIRKTKLNKRAFIYYLVVLPASRKCSECKEKIE